MEAHQLGFGPLEIAEQGQDNFQDVVFGTIAYLKRRGMSVEEWAIFLGEQFAHAWEQGHGARDFMEKAALNVVSAGASLRSLSGNDVWAESVVGDWPPEGKLSSEKFSHFFGLTQEEVDPFWEVFRPIAHYLGFEYEWHRESEQKLSFTFYRS